MEIAVSALYRSVLDYLLSIDVSNLDIWTSYLKNRLNCSETICMLLPAVRCPDFQIRSEEKESKKRMRLTERGTLKVGIESEYKRIE